jgi:hypothetical protein
MGGSRSRNIASFFGVGTVILGLMLSAVVLRPHQATDSDAYAVLPPSADVGDQGAR